MNMKQAAPMGATTRISSESAWPLRGVDGLTFAERQLGTVRPLPESVKDLARERPPFGRR